MGQKRELIKAGVGLIVGIGVSTIVGGATGLVRPRDIGKIRNFCVGVGAIVLASMASDRATEYVEEKIDEVADGIETILSKDDDEEKEEKED